MPFYAFTVTITSPLPDHLGHIPMSPVIDFGAMISQAGLPGVMDPNAIEIIDLADHAIIPHARTEDFAYGDKGRLEWVIKNSSHTRYEIRFATVDVRPPLIPQPYAPLTGVGDLIRYNADEPRPITMGYSMKLIDLTGDGSRDLVGCWNYYHRPGSPVSGLICYPRTSPDQAFTFGDLARIRYVETLDSDELKHFEGVYVEADFADVNGDGLVDIVFTCSNKDEVTFFLNTGRRDHGGLPIFVKDRSLAVTTRQNEGINLVDFDGHGILDLVVHGHYIRNTNPKGWPFEPDEPVDLDIGRSPAFMDLTGDGWLDVIYLTGTGCEQQLVWRRNTGQSTLSFGAEHPLEGINVETCTLVSAVQDGDRRGVLVQHTMFQSISFFEWVGYEDDRPVWQPIGRATSISAVLQCSDQAWPCLCDWHENGVTDLLIGGGYGWPRIVLNKGTNERPAYRESEVIFSEGQPIRVLRDEMLGSTHWHNMGYPYPACVDWDGDGLKDLMLPNETNRMVWYKNIGTKENPAFGPRQYLEVDGYPDSPALRIESGRKGEDRSLPNHPYPDDESSPFWWRTGAAFADWNGDGLMDLITHDETRRAMLYVQYRDGDGRVRLRKHDYIRLEDGRLIDDSIVGRTKHWTESFRPVDWNGDGLTDLIYNTAGTGKIYLLQNVGTQKAPVFAAPREFKCYGEDIAFTIHGPNAWPGDLNGDGKPDLVGCVEWSVYPFYCHAALEMDAHPVYGVGELRIEN